MKVSSTCKVSVGTSRTPFRCHTLCWDLSCAQHSPGASGRTLPALPWAGARAVHHCFLLTQTPELLTPCPQGCPSRLPLQRAGCTGLVSGVFLCPAHSHSSLCTGFDLMDLFRVKEILGPRENGAQSSYVRMGSFPVVQRTE